MFFIVCAVVIDGVVAVVIDVFVLISTVVDVVVVH